MSILQWLALAALGALAVWRLVRLVERENQDPLMGGIQSVAAVSSTNVWAVGGQRFCTCLFSAGPNPQFEQPGRSSGLVSAEELHVRSGVQGQ